MCITWLLSYAELHSWLCIIRYQSRADTVTSDQESVSATNGDSRLSVLQRQYTLAIQSFQQQVFGLVNLVKTFRFR